MGALIPVFLTAYDPLDVPGGSLDPLGFGTAFNALAEEWMPGLTGAGAQPMYLPLLCGALKLVEDELGSKLSSASPAQRKKLRIDIALRLERAWAIASALAAADDPDVDGSLDLDLPGLRGVRYLQREVERIRRDNRHEIGTEYPLLARQYAYGMMGIYAGVAERLKLLDKAEFAPSASIGAELGAAFLASTLPGTALRRGVTKMALEQSATLSSATLKTWGSATRPRLGEAFPAPLARPLREGLVSSRQRHVSLALVERSIPTKDEGMGEIDVIERSLDALDDGALDSWATADETRRLRCVLATIIAFDRVFRWSVVGLERLLHIARGAGDAANVDIAETDEIVARGHQGVADALTALTQCREELFERGLHDTARRLSDVVGFAGRAGRSATPREFVDAILIRHRDVQHGKLDRGRRKLPWIERQGDLLSVTSSLAGGSRFIVEEPGHIAPHAWRTFSARNYIAAVGGVL